MTCEIVNIQVMLWSKP